DGAVVAAGSIVTRDVPPYAVVGGNKAEVIRFRFPESQIQALQELAWWRFEPKQFLHLDVTDPGRLVDQLSALVDDLQPYTPGVVPGADLGGRAGARRAPRSARRRRRGAHPATGRTAARSGPPVGEPTTGPADLRGPRSRRPLGRGRRRAAVRRTTLISSVRD